MAPPSLPGHRIAAVAEALLVAFLWATSWIFIKVGLQDIPPVTFAAVRYFAAFVLLLVVLLVRDRGRRLPQIPAPARNRMVALGLLQGPVIQSLMFLAIGLMSVVTANLILSFVSLGVALAGAIWLGERPARLQWAGVILALGGAVIYFTPVDIAPTQTTGIVVALACLAASVLSVIWGRDLNRTRAHPSLLVTVITMGVGSIGLLVLGLVVDGLPAISTRSWILILWLAAVHTALPFVMWNHALRTLAAVETSIATGTTIFWMPILAVLFLGEQIAPRESVGLIIAGAGTLLVQVRGGSAGAPAAQDPP